MKPVDVITEIIIACPLRKLAEYSSNPDNAPLWYVNIKSIEWKTKKTIARGTRITFTSNFLGKKLSYIYEITVFDPNKKLVMKTANGPFPMETSYEWIPIDENRTKMILRNSGIPSGFSKIFAPFMSIAMKRANKKDLQLLKEITEKLNKN